MVPCVIGKLSTVHGKLILAARCRVISFLAGKLQLAVSIEPEGNLTHLQQLGIA